MQYALHVNTANTGVGSIKRRIGLSFLFKMVTTWPYSSHTKEVLYGYCLGPLRCAFINRTFQKNLAQPQYLFKIGITFKLWLSKVLDSRVPDPMWSYKPVLRKIDRDSILAS